MDSHSRLAAAQAVTLPPRGTCVFWTHGDDGVGVFPIKVMVGIGGNKSNGLDPHTTVVAFGKGGIAFEVV
jgi:hypothetical protein